MKQLILDYSKWRCGGDGGEYVLGEGFTKLHNPEGFECCLGQFSLQLSPDMDIHDLMDKAEPEEIGKELLPLAEYVVDEEEGYSYYRSTRLSNSAMTINDRIETTPEEKIEQLRDLFRIYNYEIKVINQPQIS